jgi:NADPH:quinone reductase
MRVVVCEAFGPVENLVVAEVPSPELVAGQVRMTMLAAGLSFVDGLLVQGLYQIKPPLPFRPGGEALGRVIEVADDVSKGLIGKRFLAAGGMTGAWATELVAPASRLIPVPDNLTDGQAATFLQSYMTGWFALTKRIATTPGESLLVLGAGSGVGLAAVDIGRALGMRVIAVASSAEKRAAALAMGAEAVIDSTTENVKDRSKELAGGNGVDVVYDPIGGALAEPCLRAMREEGRYLVIGFAAGSIPSFPINQVLLRNRSVIGVEYGGWVMRFPAESTALTAEVLEHLAAGTLRPVEPGTYPLEQVASALNALGNREVTGKLALIP